MTQLQVYLHFHLTNLDLSECQNPCCQRSIMWNLDWGNTRLNIPVWDAHRNGPEERNNLRAMIPWFVMAWSPKIHVLVTHATGDVRSSGSDQLPERLHCVHSISWIFVQFFLRFLQTLRIQRAHVFTRHGCCFWNQNQNPSFRFGHWLLISLENVRSQEFFPGDLGSGKTACQIQRHVHSQVRTNL